MEIVMAALVSLIAFTGVMGLVTYTLRSNYATRSIGSIISMSNDLFTSLETMDYASITTASDTIDSDYTRSWTVSEANSAKTVNLTISHLDALGRTHTRTFTEIYADPDASGFIDSTNSLP